PPHRSFIHIPNERLDGPSNPAIRMVTRLGGRAYSLVEPGLTFRARRQQSVVPPHMMVFHRFTHIPHLLFSSNVCSIRLAVWRRAGAAHRFFRGRASRRGGCLMGELEPDSEGVPCWSVRARHELTADRIVHDAEAEPGSPQ